MVAHLTAFGYTAYTHISVRDTPGTPCDIVFSLQDGRTPLMVVSARGQAECVKVLLAGGAQANHKSKVGTVQGWIQDFWIDIWW